MAITVRNETADDFAAVRSVTEDAFANCPLGHNGEADLVENLRSASTQCLSLVACENDSVLGHLLFTPAKITTGDQEIAGVALGPMSVLTSRQRSGIGTALMEHGLGCLSKMDVPFVVVVGHADYYTRFGFVSAAAHELVHGFEAIPQEFLFIRSSGNEPAPQSGRVHFHSTFGEQFVS